MTRETILRERLEMARHNLCCCSATYAMDTPKEGHEADFNKAAEEVRILEAWIKEFHRSHSGSTVEYIGYLSTISYGRSFKGKAYADEIEFEVDTGAGFMYGDRRILKVGTEVQDWFVGEKNTCCGRYDIEKDRRDSRKLKITVDTINVVRYIEWTEKEEA